MINFSRRNKTILANNEDGLIMITIIAVVTAMLIVGVSLISATSGQYKITANNTYAANALLVSEAGVEQTLQQLNASDSFPGYTTEQTFFDNATQGKGVYTTTLSASSTDANAKIITSTGKIYKYGGSKVIKTRITKVTAVGTGSAGYSVYSGPGGLILGGSASITNSSIYVNGKLSLSGASRIGTNSQPLSVNVANQACPSGNNPGEAYPLVCANSEPISLAQSTAIYGSVCATGQTSLGPNNNIKPGTSGTGLQTGCVAPTVSTPTYDRAAQIAAVTTTAAGNNNAYVCNSWPFNRTWNGNLKLTGNVNIGSSCNLVVRGNVYITGDLDIGGAARITVDNSVGETRPVIMVDGKITVNGSAQLIANSSGTGIQFISFKSSASCSPNCTSLSGSNLKTSSGLETVDIGGAANLSGMVFQAYWGKISVRGSGTLGSAIGQTVDLTGAGTLTFGTTLSSGSKTWTISSYQQKFPGQP